MPQVLERKQRILEWACKKSYAEISQRIDELLIEIAQDFNAPTMDDAKFEAQELAMILHRRKR